MTDYVRVFETTNETEANDYIKKGWDLISTPTKTSFDGEGGYSSYTQYTLGLSAKEYANKLLTVIREYEKYGFKELLVEKIEQEMDDKIEEYDTVGFWVAETPLTRYMSEYEDVVNDEKVKYYKNKENEFDNPPS